MRLVHIAPAEELETCIDSWWVFESSAGVPAADNRVVAPNARPKIIIPFRNALCTSFEGNLTEYSEQDIYFIGVWDKPVVLSSAAAPTGTIGIELAPQAAHRFLRLPLSHTANRILTFAELFGQEGADLQRRINATGDVQQMIELMQSFLTARLRENRQNLLVDYSIRYIEQHQGVFRMDELERKTGYTRRYLTAMFDQHLGISPKAYSGIVRFQQLYREWATTETADFFRNGLYELYYDQAHFIREFKRYTGYSPRQYASASNEFGKIFYRSR